VLTTISYFLNEYEMHIRDKRCLSFVCEGMYTTPCMDACPANIKVHGYVILIAQGKFREALELIKKRNPFPSICGRVCHHPCEIRCRRAEMDGALALRTLKRFVADHEIELERGEPKPRVEKFRAEKVAIIGSGPAGLSCAYYLVRRGYRVTVFEALETPGGMMAVGIPNYRLPKRVLRLEIDDIVTLGAEMKVGTEIGKDISFNDLIKEFNAVFVACGARHSAKLNIPGEESKGVVPVLDFLRDVNLGNPIEIGRRVMVIGGEDSAIDAARTAVRLDAKEVILLYRRSLEEMPARKEDIDDAKHEGVKIETLVAPVKVLSTAGGCGTTAGKVVGLECIKMKLGEFDKSGRRRPIPIEGSEFKIDADMVIPAVGRSVDFSFLAHKLEIADPGTIKVDENQMTSYPGVFAGGDAVTGPKTVISAIGQGMRAGEEIDKYLNNGKVSEEVVAKTKISYPTRALVEEEMEVVETKRPIMPTIKKVERVKGFEEVELGFTKEMAIAEAKRCLRCYEKGE
ncbi:MAG TPA: hypothetical protein DHV62_00595, partial [Elusimicrobia bacterium]|nr:hypothetical protein [Elusimicrobiota bacterium]